MIRFLKWGKKSEILIQANEIATKEPCQPPAAMSINVARHKADGSKMRRRRRIQMGVPNDPIAAIASYVDLITESVHNAVTIPDYQWSQHHAASASQNLERYQQTCIAMAELGPLYGQQCAPENFLTALHESLHELRKMDSTFNSAWMRGANASSKLAPLLQTMLSTAPAQMHTEPLPLPRRAAN